MTMTPSRPHRNTLIPATLSAAFSLALTGCGLGTTNPAAQVPVSVHGSAIKGSVFGGQQPVAGSTIQLYATGTGGYGTAAAPLIAATIKTDTRGNFDVTNDYTCPSASAPTYLVSTGGNSGYTDNPNLALMAALGPCGNLSTATSVNINEVTTVASVYALASFMSGSTASYRNIATSGGNASGLVNAMNDVNLLVNVATGATPGASAPSTASVPTREIYTLADIIASCINSQGGTYNDGSSCGTLFFNANPGGTSASAPTDTITALMNIAQHPALSAGSMQALYDLATPASPFPGGLTAQPNDFTMAVTFTDPSLKSPSSLAIDSTGNVWLANSTGNTVTEFSHTGTTLSGSGFTAAFNTPSAIAIAQDGTLWIANRGNNTISRIDGLGAPVSGSPYSGGGLNLPSSIAVDAQGTVWVGNSGNSSVTSISSTGGTLVNYTPSGISAPLALAINPH